MTLQTNDLSPAIAHIRAIRGVILDVDGVLTSGDISYDNLGNEIKTFNVHDGYGIKDMQRSGIRVAIMSGRHSLAVERRAQELGISDVYQGLEDKTVALKKFVKKHKFTYAELVHIGDDIPDIAIFEQVGLAIAVANAVPEVKQAADIVLSQSGGDGAVREFADWIRDMRER